MLDKYFLLNCVFVPCRRFDGAVAERGRGAAPGQSHLRTLAPERVFLREHWRRQNGDAVGAAPRLIYIIFHLQSVHIQKKILLIQCHPNSHKNQKTEKTRSARTN